MAKHRFNWKRAIEPTSMCICVYMAKWLVWLNWSWQMWRKLCTKNNKKAKCKDNFSLKQLHYSKLFSKPSILTHPERLHTSPSKQTYARISHININSL